MAAPWIPTEQPYRTSWIYTAPAQPGGWGSRVETFATLDEALEAAKRPFTGGVYRADVTRADFTFSWQRDGRWTILARRKRKQGLVMTPVGIAALHRAQEALDARFVPNTPGDPWAREKEAQS